jgi:hypothetical protein
MVLISERVAEPVVAPIMLLLVPAEHHPVRVNPDIQAWRSGADAGCSDQLAGSSSVSAAASVAVACTFPGLWWAGA